MREETIMFVIRLINGREVHETKGDRLSINHEVTTHYSPAAWEMVTHRVRASHGRTALPDLRRRPHPDLALISHAITVKTAANSPNSYSSRLETAMTSLFTEAPAAVATPQVRSPNPLRSLLAGLVLAVALLGLVAAAGPTAHADAVQNNFLGALSSRGITFASGQSAIVAGREVCDELDQGRQASDIANDVMTQTNLDGYHAGFFVGVSIAAFCPRHSQ
jgi:hypothetical protein